jgi:hypothetical protein
MWSLEIKVSERSCVEIKVAKASRLENLNSSARKGGILEQNLGCESELLGVGSTGEFLSIPQSSSLAYNYVCVWSLQAFGTQTPKFPLTAH